MHQEKRKRSISGSEYPATTAAMDALPNSESSNIAIGMTSNITNQDSPHEDQKQSLLEFLEVYHLQDEFEYNQLTYNLEGAFRSVKNIGCNWEGQLQTVHGTLQTFLKNCADLKAACRFLAGNAKIVSD